MATCPTCGQQCRGNPLLIDTSGLLRYGHRDIHLPRGHVTQLLRALNGVYPGSLSRSQLLDVIYGDDPGGGPLAACESLWAKIHRLRTLVRPAGIEIRSTRGAYRIELASQLEKAA